jgi:hypothetical protein
MMAALPCFRPSRDLLGGMLRVAPHLSMLPLTAHRCRTLLILAGRFGAGLLRARGLRFGSGCVLPTGAGCSLRTGGGCVLRTASANISCSSALFGAEGFVIFATISLSTSRLP